MPETEDRTEEEEHPEPTCTCGRSIRRARESGCSEADCPYTR